MWRDFPAPGSAFVNCDCHTYIWKQNYLLFPVMEYNSVPGEWLSSAVLLRWGQQWKHLMSSACPPWENCTWCQRLSKSNVVYLFKSIYCSFFIWGDRFFYLSVPNHSHCLQIKYRVPLMCTRLPTGSAFYGVHLVVLFQFWVMTERMGSCTQAALMTFYRRMTGLGFKGKLRSVKTLDREPPGYFLLKRTRVEVQEHAMWIIYIPFGLGEL